MKPWKKEWMIWNRWCNPWLPKSELKMRSILTLFAMVISMGVQAQSYSISWYKVAGGGDTSSNGQYSVSSTIGQPDASGAQTGGAYSVTGGFWSLMSAVQTPGLPNLIVTHTASSVIVSWPDTGNYTLQ
jgi:hypothetical protein